MKKDVVKRYIAHNGTVSVTIADTSFLLSEANRIHNLYNTSLAALGRTMTMGCIMGTTLKNDTDRITLQIKGDGPLEGIVVCTDNKCNIKGYTYNNATKDLKENGKLDVSGIIGKGFLTVIKDTGGKEPYVSKVKLVSGEIAEDFAYYYSISEQIPTVVSLGVLLSAQGEVIKSGGYLIQVMPGIEEETLTLLENISSTVTSITSLLLQDIPYIEMAQIISGDDNIKELSEIEPKYTCDCCKDRIEKAIIALGVKEVESILDEQGKIEINCSFCGKNYSLSREECLELFEI